MNLQVVFKTLTFTKVRGAEHKGYWNSIWEIKLNTTYLEMVLPSKHLASHSKWDGNYLLTPEIPESETKQECTQNDQVWWAVTGWSLKIN